MLALRKMLVLGVANPAFLAGSPHVVRVLAQSRWVEEELTNVLLRLHLNAE